MLTRFLKCVMPLGFVFLFIGLTVNLSYARPPSQLDLKYDSKAKVLTVYIVHATINPQKHFIRVIHISKNVEEPIKYNYNRQPSNREFQYEYPIDLKSKDTVTVKAFCSDAGIKETTLVIP